MKISKGDRFIDMRTGNVIQVLNANDDGRCTVATVTITGRLENQRKITGSNLYTSYTTKSGEPRRSGYVKADKIPSGHHFAIREGGVSATVLFMDEEIDYKSMTMEELANFTEKRLVQAALLSGQAEDAKEEMRRRNPRRGTTIFGDVAVIAEQPTKFSEALAKEKLSPGEFDAICIQKPDSKMARKLLAKSLYESLCEPGKTRLTIRHASDKDRENAEMTESAERIARNPESAQMGLDADDKPPF